MDLAGRLVVPGLVDAHQHLDKSRLRLANPDGTLGGAVAAFGRYAATMTGEDVLRRAGRTLGACVARGTVAVRSHANVDLETGTRAVAALVELRERWRDRVTLQVVAFVTASAARAEPRVGRRLLEQALDAGADAVGGTPALAPDPAAFLGMLFDVAARRGRPVDLHVDEHLDPARRTIERVIEATRAFGMEGRVIAGHCSVLAALPPEDAARIVEGLARARIAVVTLPAANLFLQGREARLLAPRGLTRVAELLAAGVPVACASDNIQDPFVPVGSGDMLEVARWTVLAAGLGPDAVATAFRMATHLPAAMLGLEPGYGVRVGAWADLLLSDAADVEDLVASGPMHRAVLFRGRLVAGALGPGVSPGTDAEPDAAR